MTSTMTAGPVLRERLTDAPVRLASGSLGDPGDAAPMPTRHRVPTMLVERELNYLYWLAGQMPEGGRAVELGCFLGGSTAALVEGMRATGKRFAPMPVYDAFLAPDSEAVTSSWWMKPFGLRAGENFRARYEQVHASRLDRIVVREGWIPEGIDRAGERTLYPEQGPIDLLFVDAAKTWGVHETILRAFVRHMKVDGVVVQQDFMDVQTPWLPLHMWQLRDVLRPLDAVRGTPSVSFECIADPSARVDEVWRGDALRDRAPREETWSRVIEFWNGLIGPAAGFIHGHAARHASMAGDLESLVRHARAYEAWSRSSASAGVYVTPTWNDAMASMAASFERAGRDVTAMRTLIAESAVRQTLVSLDPRGSAGGFFSPDVRAGLWRGVQQQLREGGKRRVALYGAGQHTQWLLEHAWACDDIAVAGIIDDAPRVKTIRGVPVMTPADAEALLRSVQAVIPSSDAHEQAIAERASVLAAAFDLPVLRVYTALPGAAPCASGSEVAAASARASGAAITRVAASALQKHAPHRAALGLAVERPWLDEFARRTGAPEWVRGHVNYRDALLLWDLVEATRPDTIVEIGTASGVSTGQLAAAGEFFGGTRTAGAGVWSFDIAERCYFDSSRPVGAAAFEAVPHLAQRIHLHPGTTCIDAARRFGAGEVDLAFIDGDHRHPAPTLDVLALLYAVRPGGWMILHDIELTEVAKVAKNKDWDVVTGAESLFHAWPFEKVQPMHDEPSMNNIGAIRLPDDPGDAAAFLLDHLRRPWETQGLLQGAVEAALASWRR
jgi:predicted O-methyltransferase YrrM